MLLAAINLPLRLKFQDYHEGYQAMDILEKFGIGGVNMVEVGFAGMHVFMYYTGDLHDDQNAEFFSALQEEVDSFNQHSN
jgi:hypothetical protein